MIRLLIVDDEEAVVDNLALTIPWDRLRIDEVHRAYSAPEALEVLESQPIHIVITDIRMPGMSGLELAKRIAERWSRVKCLILSGFADFDYAKQALRHHTVDYLLKPIRESDLLQAVEGAIEQLEREWESIGSLERAQSALLDHLPLLRSNLLSELLQGRRLPPDTLREKLELFRLPFAAGDVCSMLLLRMDAECDFQTRSLLEYAIGNIAEELGEGRFELWSCKDEGEHLVFGLKWKEADTIEAAANREETGRRLVERLAVQLQENVKVCLKIGVSVVVAGWASFPDGMARLYQQALAAVRERLGRDGELIVVADGGEDEAEARMPSLSRLYEPPHLQHLLDAGRWDLVQEKLQAIFDELEQLPEASAEHALEIYLLLSSSAAYIAHKSGQQLSGLLGEDAEPIVGARLRPPPNLRGWAERVFRRIQFKLEREMKDNRCGIVKRVHNFIDSRLSEDVSIQSIAEHVYLHPAYLSRVYKLETGQSIGQYLLSLRMEKAAALLRSGNDKIMDVAFSLGYQNATYFSKVFKSHYGMTPQLFREQGALPG